MLVDQDIGELQEGDLIMGGGAASEESIGELKRKVEDVIALEQLMCALQAER